MHVSKEALSPRIDMPSWLRKVEDNFLDEVMPSPEKKLRFVIHLACENVRRHTGGPFAAAVFERSTDQLIAVGVNVVVPARQSNAHAEMIAIANAQNKCDSFQLSGGVLVASCEPCVMCYGGVLWSGVEELIYGAPGSFAAAVGFDEGDKVADWHRSLIRRGIAVSGPLLEEEAGEPFSLYQSLGGVVYGQHPSQLEND